MSSLIDRLQLNHARANLFQFARALQDRAAAARRGLRRSGRLARDRHHQSSTWQWSAWVAALVVFAAILLIKPMFLPWLLRLVSAGIAMAFVTRGLAFRAAAAETERNQGGVTVVLNAWRRATMHWFWLMQYGFTLGPLLLASLLLWDGRLGLLPLPAAAGAWGLCAYALAGAGRRTPTLLGICLHHGDKFDAAAAWHLLMRFEAARRHDLGRPGSRFSRLANLLENPDRTRQMPQLPLPAAGEWHRELRRRLPRLLLVWALAAVLALPLWWLTGAAFRLPHGGTGFAQTQQTQNQNEAAKSDAVTDSAQQQTGENSSEKTNSRTDQHTTTPAGDQTTTNSSERSANQDGGNSGKPNQQGTQKQAGDQEKNASGKPQNGDSASPQQKNASSTEPSQPDNAGNPSQADPQSTKGESEQQGESDPANQPNEGAGQPQNAPGEQNPDSPAASELDQKQGEAGQTPSEDEGKPGGAQTTPANQQGEGDPSGGNGDPSGGNGDPSGDGGTSSDNENSSSEATDADADGSNSGQTEAPAEAASESQEGMGQNGSQGNQTGQGGQKNAANQGQKNPSASQAGADQGSGGASDQPSESTVAGGQNTPVQQGSGGPVPDFPNPDNQIIEIEIPTLMGDGDGLSPNPEQAEQQEPPPPRRAGTYRDGRAPEQTPSATQPLPAWVAELLRDHRATNTDKPTKQQQ